MNGTQTITTCKKFGNHRITCLIRTLEGKLTRFS